MGIANQAETTINKFGGDIIIGYQTFAFDRLVVDIYAGLGGRYSEYKFKGQTKLKFNDFLYDYGFTGNILLVGVRLGLGF
ncbi:MAG: hypothetical protein HC905_30285 [Bacteroidales bacterium]|nr:hypothetical protein [Bacteroidales bacterium]